MYVDLNHAPIKIQNSKKRPPLPGNVSLIVMFHCYGAIASLVRLESTSTSQIFSAVSGSSGVINPGCYWLEKRIIDLLK